MNSWSQKDLSSFINDEAIKIEPFYADGQTHNTPIPIWFVIQDNNLYIRAYSGVNSSWYQSAILQKNGLMTAAGKEYKVTFTAVKNNPELDQQINQAYKDKYAGQEPLEGMITSVPMQATLLITPKS